MKDVRLTIHGHKMTAQWGEHAAEATFVLHATRNPAEIDIMLTRGPKALEGKTFLGRYVLEDGRGGLFIATPANRGRKN